MRKREELTRGARFSGARAKAIKAAKAAMKKAKVDKSTTAKVLEGFGQIKDAPKAKAVKKAAPVKRTPSGRRAKPEEVKKSGGGRGKGERLLSIKPVKSTGGSRIGKGKQSRDTKLFKGKFTSRGNRR
jgi:hypothetical protein